MYDHVTSIISEHYRHCAWGYREDCLTYWCQILLTSVSKPFFTVTQCSCPRGGVPCPCPRAKSLNTTLDSGPNILDLLVLNSQWCEYQIPHCLYGSDCIHSDMVIIIITIISCSSMQQHWQLNAASFINQPAVIARIKPTSLLVSRQWYTRHGLRISVNSLTTS